MNKETLTQEQIKMQKKILIPKDEHFNLKKHQLIFSLDIQYQEDFGFVAVDIQNAKGEHKGTFVGKYKAEVEYQPGFFAFREGPLLIKAVNDVIQQKRFQPSLLVIDGHGTAHPRKLGVATWVGIQTEIPSIGIAKEPLLKTEYSDFLSSEKGETIDVVLEDEVVGFVLRSQTNVKPIFVSAGHKISQKEALRITQSLSGEFRIVEPIRRADQAARAAAKSEISLDF